MVFVDILLSTQNINDENMGKFFSCVKKLNMTDKSNQHRPLGVKSSLASVAVFLKKSTLIGKHCYSILDINITMLFEKSIQRISFTYIQLKICSH